jgi:hypothetical protein
MAPKKEAKKAIKKTKADGDKPKRGPSSYMLYVKENRDRVIKEYGLDPKQIAPIGKKCGELWNALSEKEKEVYKKKAADLAPPKQ